MSTQADLQLLKLGRRLVHSVFITHRTTANYVPGHPALAPLLAELAAVISEFDRHHEEARLVLQDGHLFLGELRLKPDAAGFEAFFAIRRLLQRCGLGAVEFSRDADTRALGAWFALLHRIEAAPPDNPFEAVAAGMAQQGITGIAIEHQQPPRPGAALPRDTTERAKAIYAQTMEVVSGVMEDVKIGKVLRLRRAKRTLQSMIDLMLTAETNLLGLTNIRCHDEYTYNHSVNVGILSMAIGQRVGFGKNSLVDLGMAAIFHDIGKSCIPLAILNKPGAFTPEEWVTMRRHPVCGVRELLKLKGADALSARIMLGAFEHHVNVDNSGYPKLTAPRELSLTGRIVAIADCYDALTSARVYRRVSDSPDRVLQYILQKSDTMYDRTLVKLFVNAVGAYPIGSLCLLSTRELAVVMEGNADPELWDKPRVKLISTPDGTLRDGEVLDLVAQSGQRWILRTLDPHHYGIDVARYFV